MQKVLCLILVIALASMSSATYYGGMMPYGLGYGMGLGYGLGMGYGGFGLGMGIGGFGLGYGGIYNPFMFGGRMGFGKYGYY